MKLTYRPEIDGLRAIAVSAVILYHAQIIILGDQPFKGGFIGVDIFFVISGYLITCIILKELVITGSFSFKYFYQRRIRRILPALLFVMLVSLPFAQTYLIPNSFVDFSKSILYSLGFSSNFYFWYSGQEYSAESGLLKPFLHTWSLSIEEQYYILFPIFFFIIFRYFKRFIIHFLILGFTISLFLAESLSRDHPSFNFYMLHARCWEFLAGSILAYFEITKGHRSKNKKLNLILPSIGLFLIGYSILFFNDKMYHPSFYTLFPIIGICLIIWFSQKNELITRILSSKLFVGIGLISYSLYLWHYPIFAFARITEFSTGSLFNKLFIGVALLLLSLISYYFIERPFRSKKNKFQVIISLILILIFILVIFNINSIQKDGYKDRLPEIFGKNFSTKPWSLLKSEGKKCFGEIEKCEFNSLSDKKIYIVGDSHMASIMFDLKDRVIKNNYQFITSTLGSCMFYPGFNLVEIKTNKVDSCNNNYFQKLKLILSEEKNSIIIFGGRLPAILSNSNFNNLEGGIEKNILRFKYVSVGEYKTIQQSYKNELLELSKDHKIILVYPIPEVGWHVPRKFLNSIPKKVDLIKDHMIPKNYITTSYEVYKNRTKSSFKLLDSIQGDKVYRVYPHTLFCDTIIKNRCLTHDDKNIFYIDDDHPSLKGAEMINDLIMKEIKKIELKSQ